MIVQNGPQGSPSVALETLSQGDAFEVVGHSQGTEFVVLGGDAIAPVVPAGQVAVACLRTGDVFLMAHDSTVTKHPLKVVPE